MSPQDHDELGPLAALVGTWEGAKGQDVAPSAQRAVARSSYRERMSFVPTGRVDNHEQILFGLRYQTTAWRLGEDAPFHEELGYWLWDAGRGQVMRCFLVPRGVSVIAGGDAASDATRWTLRAKLGDPCYGICSNQFLHEQFRTLSYELSVEILGPDSFCYHEDTVLQMPGRDAPFHHTDGNTMTRVAGA